MLMARTEAELVEQAKKILEHNDRGNYTVPAGDLYPHQWLWDSCFIAIGLRHLDPGRAQKELTSLLRGQWANGMLPNIIFSQGKAYRRDREIWRSYINPYAPNNVATSGITQPPLLAEAVVRVGEKLKITERRSWYRRMYPHLLSYHQWLYLDRDPHKEGLVILLHPYESGLDSTPPWISEMRRHSMPLWLSTIEKLHLDWMLGLFRRDLQHASLAQRMDNVEAAGYWAALYRLRRKAYNSEALLSRSLFAVEDLTFNSILVRANAQLKDIAKNLKEDLPVQLLEQMKKTEGALEELWSEADGQYFNRSFVGHELIEESTISTLLPLYAGTISEARASRLVGLLKNPRRFGAKWPVPSVPLNSPYFNQYRYWQGPSWINTNWLIIDGLRRYGFFSEANKLTYQTLEMVKKGGFYEYFSPMSAAGAGAANFSWTAALAIDLIKS
jgi:glycogen debranching enzyme